MIDETDAMRRELRAQGETLMARMAELEARAADAEIRAREAKIRGDAAAERVRGAEARAAQAVHDADLARRELEALHGSLRSVRELLRRLTRRTLAVLRIARDEERAP